ncbi:response regulator (plasmid) [Rhizobium sp. TH2]|uniref:response regulator transcription factor n=1 Tax=Rhizobium sp. TH2 TaxID=2775403 RepID=UPI0021571AC7|nr:response regulator [Rhizobium sp. TH2]UVC12532.1 response regulator [Rhizobium sp. TH2]
MPQTIEILVVEDELLVRMDIADHLADRGYVVYEAGNADEAIVILENHKNIRLIVTDIDMPGSMDGLKLAAAVRDRWPPVKIIVVSGHHTIEVTDLPDGSMFFSQPYLPSKLVESMRELLSHD